MKSDFELDFADQSVLTDLSAGVHCDKVGKKKRRRKQKSIKQPIDQRNFIKHDLIHIPRAFGQHFPLAKSRLKPVRTEITTRVMITSVNGRKYRFKEAILTPKVS